MRHLRIGNTIAGYDDKVARHMFVDSPLEQDLLVAPNSAPVAVKKTKADERAEMDRDALFGGGGKSMAARKPKDVEAVYDAAPPVYVVTFSISLTPMHH